MIAALSRIISILALAAAALPLAASARAAEPEPYLVEYRAYNAALQAGDATEAATHGLAAWQAAEQALGDHRLTGILAYNYGRLLIFSATEEAAAPLRRASELQQSGVAELPQDALRLYRRYAEFAVSGFEEGPADELREALDAVGLQDEELVHEVAPMWVKLTTEYFANEEYRKAMESASRAEAAVRKAKPDASRELAQVIMLGAVARIGRKPRTIDRLEDATVELDRARRLFPPQDDIDTFDPLLAQVRAWQVASEHALKALYKAKGRRAPDSDDDESAPYPPLFAYAADESLECGELEWEERTAPDYPFHALNEGYLGAVLLGYRLGEDLKVHDARVLAEVPVGERFGKVSLDALSDWRVKSLPDGGPECYQNFVTSIGFVIE